MKVVFLEEAQSEFLEAIDYDEGARAGLGRRFKVEVDSKVRWIAQHPELYRLRESLFRRVNLRVFPYFLPYVVRGDTLWVLAVAHGSRQPRYWISRRLRIP